MEVGIVRQVDIEHEMRTAYLDYAMSVITARALPDVRDGLKPVQRRILYAMNDMGLQHDKPYKKSARIVGEVLGKYHPHGDMAVYDSMTRLAQDFTMRYPLVDGQGNFGSIDGDNPAAMRYTEARLSAVAAELLEDLDKDTVDFTDNFDGTLKEPTVLPARLPNLLLNGASGIAVGMATNVPPHNLVELADAIAYLVDNSRRLEAVAVDELLELVKGPDFPTGGTILGLEGIRTAYATGAGNIVVRAKAHFEDAGGGKSLIIVTELPYQVGKAALIEKIAELVREKKIDSISDLRDESDRQGMRMVIELKRGAEPKPTLMDLYRYTPMQSTFNVNMLALVDGEPRVLSLRRALQLFIEHRQEVITRRTRFELERARMHAHILEGLTKALDHLDAVIKTIRESQTADTARQNLMSRFKFSEIQAQAILDLQLRRLAALERKKIEDEYAETLKRIDYLEGLLANPKKILALVKSDALELKERYGDPRRTRISAKEAEQIQVQDLIPEQDTYVAITQKGQIRRGSDRGDFFSATGRDATVGLVSTNTLHSVLLCTDKGRCFTLQVHQVPESQTGGVAISDVLNLEPDESVKTLAAVPSFAEGIYLTLCTTLGRVKRVAISEFASVRAGGLTAMGLDQGDELRFALVTSGGQELMLVTAQGQALRFGEDDVRPMGRGAGGVNGIKLDEGDEVVAFDLVKPGAGLVVVTEKGWTKRTPLTEYPSQGRYGKGVVALPTKYFAQTGKLVAARVVQDGDEVGFAMSSGASVRIRAGGINAAGRALRGLALPGLRASERVLAMVSVPGQSHVAGDATSKAKAEPAGLGKRASTASRSRSRSSARKAPPAPRSKRRGQ